MLGYRVVLSALVLAVVGCGDDANTLSSGEHNSGFASCSQADKNSYWDHVLKQEYYWVNDLNHPQLSYPEYANSNLFLADVLPLKDRFSNVTATENFNNQTQGQAFGLGVRLKISAEGLYVSQVYQNSSADTAGLARGDQILSVGGLSGSDLANLWLNGNYSKYNQAFGPNQDGYPVTLTWQASTGEEYQKTLNKSSFTVNTVPYAGILPSNAGKIAYLAFPEGFLKNSSESLLNAFKFFKHSEFDHFILDLRNNRGGLLSQVGRLALYLSSERLSEQAFVEIRHNSKLSYLDSSETPEDLLTGEGLAPQLITAIKNLSLNLTKMTVLTNRASASASEVLINSLDVEAYLDVTLIGETTFGKPVGFYPHPSYCGETLLAVNFATYNAAGDGDYLSGLQPDCPIADDAQPYPWGDTRDPVLAAAIADLSGQQCPTLAAKFTAEPSTNEINSANIPVLNLFGLTR
ncbi:S41 family peptidase [Gayadomonas joobiniege]|uniref:S41 family peptidase n=1 Tax=Gayadomonas joobiniege TaxID=1234606 RepID=UPI00035DF3F0|nr:S41 family peptidase [Gayadomonas joobiniege]